MLHNNEISEYYDECFEGIIHNQAITSKLFEECTFINCNFSHATLKSCKFRYCKFIRCNLSLVNITSCAFVDIQFSECKIIGVNWTYCELLWMPIIFHKSNISQSTFMGLKLQSVTISDCIVRECDFRECDLSKAMLTENDFHNTLFGKTNFSHADLTNSINYVIDIRENQLKGAKFSLPEAITLLHSLEIELS